MNFKLTLQSIAMFLIACTNNILLGDMVIVYHDIGRGGNVESVKKHGLLTLKELFKKGLTKDNPSELKGVLPDQYDVIYFTPKLNEPDDTNIVGYLVDADSTYVYNREYRFDRNRGKYQGSEVLLATYLANKKLAEQMRISAPEHKAVIFNPRTSEPFYVDYSDKRYYDPSPFHSIYNSFSKDESQHYCYWGEVIINKNCIPPEELIFLN